MFVTALTVIRSRSTARLVVAALGAAPLLSAAALTVEFLFGAGTGAFLARRLNSPMGYVNGTAGLMVMGVWPWLAISDRADRRSLRVGAHAAATLIAASAAMSQSRAVIPALVVAIVVALTAEHGRTRRAVLLLLMFLGIAVALRWIFHVYTQGGFADHNLPPTHSALRGAGAAILISAVLIGGLRLLGSLVWGRVDHRNKRGLERRLGYALLGGATIVVVCAAGFGWSPISAQ